MEVKVSLRQEEDGRWVGAVPDGQDVPGLLTKGASREDCLEKVRRALERSLAERPSDAPLTLVVETTPRLAGVAEAARIMGWDKRRVITYISRRRFPEPLQSLASGRVWVRSTIEDFAREWKARQAKRKPPGGVIPGQGGSETSDEGLDDAHP